MEGKELTERETNQTKELDEALLILLGLRCSDNPTVKEAVEQVEQRLIKLKTKLEG